MKLSANQRVDLRSRWKAGQSLHQIGRAFGKSHVSIHFILSQHGGICSGSSSAIASNTHTGGARGHLAKDRFRFVDS